jgi:inner membrane protein
MLAGRSIAEHGRSRAIGPMLLCSGLAMLPDLDYVGVMLGVPNTGPCGHRGATHSLVLPLIVAVAAASVRPREQLSRLRLAAICGLVVASHPFLDALTGDSRGVPLLWPFSFLRFAMPWRPIPNAPCGLEFISVEGLRVASIELLMCLPILMLALWPAFRGLDGGDNAPGQRCSRIVRGRT